MNTKTIPEQYDEKFGNFAEIAMQEIIADPRFNELLSKAVQRNRELTREEINAVFPGVAWDY